MAGSERYQFFVDESGRLHESSVHESLSRLFEVFSGLDVAAMEAEIMLERCHRLLALERDARWAPLGLTGSRFILLRILYSSPGQRLSMGKIAAQMNLEPNNVTQLIATLIRRGLVRKEPDAADRRVIYASLTSEGEALFTAAMQEGAASIKHAFSVLDDRERQNLGHLLTKVRMHLLANASRLEEDHSSDKNRVLAKRGAHRGSAPKQGRTNTG